MGKADKIILAIIALVALVSMGIFLLMWQNQTEGATALVSIDGEQIMELKKIDRSTFQNMGSRLCWKSRTIRSGFYPQTVPTICVQALDGSTMNLRARSVCQTVWQSRLLENKKGTHQKMSAFFMLCGFRRHFADEQPAEAENHCCNNKEDSRYNKWMG